jgi:hypothetical protein
MGKVVEHSLQAEKETAKKKKTETKNFVPGEDYQGGVGLGHRRLDDRKWRRKDGSDFSAVGQTSLVFRLSV